MDFSGVVPPMVTPATDDRSAVDTAALASFTEFLVEGGVHGLFPCGSIGEFPSLARDQRSTVIETVVDNASDVPDVPVLAGCGGTSVQAVRQLVADAAAVGADAAVVVTPYYLTTDAAGLVEFYERVLEDTPLPIVLYDIPSLTGNRLPIEVVAELASHEEVVAIKDSTGEFSHHQELIEVTPDSVQVLQGLAELAIASLDIGTDGVVAGPANCYPGVLAELYEAHERGDRERAIDLHRNVVNPIVAATKSSPTAAALKYLLERQGHAVGDPFPPLSLLASSARDRLDECHQRVCAPAQTVESPASRSRAGDGA